MSIPPGLLQGIERLDPLPVTLQRLVHALNDENVGAVQIGEHVQYDPAVAATLLKVANSAAYGGWSRTETLRDAVMRLGKARVLDIVLGDHLRRMRVSAPMYDLAEGELWAHSAAASLAVKAIARERPRAGVPESASVAALVHDVGKLVMVRFLKADVSAILAVRDRDQVSFVQAERVLFGCDHAQVGGAIARRWGFPADIQEAVARHHESPIAASTPTLDAVVVANVAAKMIGTGLGAEGMDIRPDEACLDRLGLDFDAFARVCDQTHVWLKELKATYGLKQ